MSNQVIPAQAVEAAARALADQSMVRRWDDLAPMVRRIRLKKMALALEAAAPYMRAQALEDAAAEIDEGVPAYGQGECAAEIRTPNAETFADRMAAKSLAAMQCQAWRDKQ